MIRLKNVFLQLKDFRKKKLIIGCSVMAVILVSGIGVYAINMDGKKDTSSEQKVEEDVTDENTSNENVEPVQEQAKEEEKPQTVQQPKVDQNAQNNTNTQNNVDNSQNKSTKSKQAEQPKEKSKQDNTKKENIQQKQVANKPITYTSKSLGLSFDMPVSWKDKYFINDNGTEIKVYTKHKENLNNGCGLLFTITSDLKDYNEGKDLDGIGHINRELTLNNRKYHLGGPLDFRMGEDDPLKDLYRNMVRDSEKVLSTLRAA